LIVTAYGLAEMNKTKKAIGTNETSLSSGNKEEIGKAIYKAYCVKCHGEDGKKGFMAAADLSLSGLDSTALIEIISNGRNGMKGYQKELSPEQINAVAAYVSSLQK
jgi:mono/diheme cytochrome c family protein